MSSGETVIDKESIDTIVNQIETDTRFRKTYEETIKFRYNTLTGIKKQILKQQETLNNHVQTLDDSESTKNLEAHMKKYDIKKNILRLKIEHNKYVIRINKIMDDYKSPNFPKNLAFAKIDKHNRAEAIRNGHHICGTMDFIMDDMDVERNWFSDMTRYIELPKYTKVK
jgi:hypothetical protein